MNPCRAYGYYGSKSCESWDSRKDTLRMKPRHTDLDVIFLPRSRLKTYKINNIMVISRPFQNELIKLLVSGSFTEF